MHFDKFFEDNELVRRRKRLTEIEAQCYLSQLISACEYLHKNKVIHRDLKLGNLFLSDKMQLKVGDFGLAARVLFDGEKKRTICGTPNYIAPELLDSKHGHSYEVDFWAIGVICYTLLFGRPPFESPDVKQTYKKIKQNQYQFPEHVAISDSAKDFIRKLLKTNPQERLGLPGMRQHSFMTSNTIPEVLPISTLVCPPSGTFYKQYQKTSAVNENRLEQTAPCATASAYSARREPTGANPALQTARDHAQLMETFETARSGNQFHSPKP